MPNCRQALVDLGYDPGGVTGVMSFKTRAALIAFQRAEGLVESGKLDEPTLERIPFALAALVVPQGDPTEGDRAEPPAQARDPEPAPEQVKIRPCEACPELVRVEGGQMAYGPRPVDDPVPPLTEAVAPFFIATTEVTMGQFAAYAEATGIAFVDAKTAEGPSCFDWQTGDKLRKTAVAFGTGRGLSDDHPVACVSRQDAQGYIDWLNEDNAGPAYRLPTEAEFEFLLERNLRYRIKEEGLSKNLHSDADLVCALGNFGDASSQFSWRNMACVDANPGEAIVASYPADANGVHDLAGNLWEWVADCWRSNLSLPKQISDCKTGTLKGGSFDDPVKNALPEARQSAPASRRQVNIGFRIARDVD